MAAHPFSWVPRHRRRRVFIITTAAAVALLAALMVLDRPLRTAAAPDGIVSFELAGTMDTARRILDSWPPKARVAAGLSLGLDYLFLVVYAMAIAMGCGLVADRLAPHRPMFSHMGSALAWSQFAAAGCDMVENLSLIFVLQDAVAPALPATARVCAIIKFAIIVAGLVYAGTGAVIIVTQNRPAPNHHIGGGE